MFRYYTQKVKKREEKTIVGPGYLENLEKNMMKEGKKAKIYSAFFGKSNAPNAIEQGAIRSKFVPGVGFYKNIDSAYTQHIVIPKDRFTKISNSAFSRYSDMAAKSKSWVPGPGAYDILPPMRKNK